MEQFEPTVTSIILDRLNKMEANSAVATTTASTSWTPSGCIDLAVAKSDPLQNGILQGSGSNRTLAAGSIFSVRRVGN